MIIYGQPNSGKTFYIKSLLKNNENNNFLYVDIEFGKNKEFIKI